MKEENIELEILKDLYSPLCRQTSAGILLIHRALVNICTKCFKEQGSEGVSKEVED